MKFTEREMNNVVESILPLLTPKQNVNDVDKINKLKISVPEIALQIHCLCFQINRKFEQVLYALQNEKPLFSKFSI